MTSKTTPKSPQRHSAFSSSASPWFRRNSFLSSAMIQSENISVYESTSYYADSTTYNIISLRECQGFIFNQDLFASPYQQAKALANERRYRSMSCVKKELSDRPRRHTSYHTLRPQLADNRTTFESALEDDDQESVDDAADELEAEITSEVDEYDEMDTGYKVHVTEIVVNENDDIFPKPNDYKHKVHSEQ